MKTLKSLIAMLTVLVGTTGSAFAWTPLPVADDPLVRMPGTQPGQITLEGPGRCLNCHADYNHSVEPGFNWKGSMMAQASRDFLFWTCQTVAAQDAIWAVGNPNATDICARCHFPIGWLEGRSDPTNNSLFRGDDYDGVNCDFCHTLYNPFFEDADTSDPEGGMDWVGYWDEASGLSTAEADKTYAEDAAITQSILLFNGNPMFANNQPVTAPGYEINAGGQYFNSPNPQKRSSYADPNAKHKILYSRYHKSKYFCSTCHDISNPILHNLTQGYGQVEPGDGSTILPTESDPAYSYFHVERTFSEFMLSDYAQQGGAEGKGPFAPDVFNTSLPGNLIGKCQDCHMRDVVGVGANKSGAPIRPDESVEHPNSGLPLHDMTGGNAWVAGILASAIPGSSNFDQVNYDLLHGPNLTLDMAAGSSNEPEAMIAGMERSRQQLELAASITDLSYNSISGALSFRLQNQTGHKLPSGFPEGRRMFVNVRAYNAADMVIYEVNPYDDGAGTLKGLDYSYDGQDELRDPCGLGFVFDADTDTCVAAYPEEYLDELVYEAHTSSSLTGEEHTFHFALATDRYKDNRVPPKGFRIDEAASRLSEPKWHGDSAPDYFTNDEYVGGYDEVNLNIIPGAANVEVNLYYQTTSREYVEFLRNEVNGDPNQHLTLPMTPSVEGPADNANYIVQTDPFFEGLKGWGDTMWRLWVHNMNDMGAAPFLMTHAVYGVPRTPCNPQALVPNLTPAEPASGQVTLTWTAAPPPVVKYTVYYDQAGKSQFLADVDYVQGLDPYTYTDTGLLNGEQYCYKVSSWITEECESEFSTIQCATPEAPGQDTLVDVVDPLSTGYYRTTGKGKNQTTTFIVTDAITRGEQVAIRATVRDDVGQPVANASVEIVISGPETTTVTTGNTDADGLGEAVWNTSAPNKKGNGGTTAGHYTATVTSVTGGGLVYSPALIPGNAGASIIISE